MSTEQRKLTERVTRHQKMLLVELMKKNRHLGCGQVSGVGSAKNNKKQWLKIASELNACGGAIKNSEQWKRCWIDWKAAVKRQYTAIKNFNNKTGNLASSSGQKKLDELDEEVVNVFFPHVFEGVGKTVESTSRSSQQKKGKSKVADQHVAQAEYFAAQTAHNLKQETMANSLLLEQERHNKLLECTNALLKENNNLLKCLLKKQ